MDKPFFVIEIFKFLYFKPHKISKPWWVLTLELNCLVMKISHGQYFLENIFLNWGTESRIQVLLNLPIFQGFWLQIPEHLFSRTPLQWLLLQRRIQDHCKFQKPMTKPILKESIAKWKLWNKMSKHKMMFYVNENNICKVMLFNILLVLT